MTNDLEISESELETPLIALVDPKKTKVRIKDMADYYEIFMGAEGTIFHLMKQDNDLNDKKVILAYDSLLRDFDGREKGSLADHVGKGIKAFLLLRKKSTKKDFTFGEIMSCLLLMKKLAIQHRSSDGHGYLKWIKAFFEGNMPTNPIDMLLYIKKNEL